jgi:hypothetical protein
MAHCRAVILAALALAALSAAAAAEPRAVIELFTSQGCSSCPPADALMGTLRRDPSLVTLSLPIDYWDYLGWKDTLADPRNSARQRAYSQVRGDREVYTPQIVVNGTAQALGSNEDEVKRAIAESRRNTATLSVPISVSVNGDQIVVDTKAQNDKSQRQSTADVIICGVAGNVPIAIGRGENRGKTITYSNVVRRWVKVGALGGTQSSWTLPLSDVKADGVDTIVVLVQHGNADKPGVMLGAATAALR